MMMMIMIYLVRSRAIWVLNDPGDVVDDDDNDDDNDDDDNDIFCQISCSLGPR